MYLLMACEPKMQRIVQKGPQNTGLLVWFIIKSIVQQLRNWLTKYKDNSHLQIANLSIIGLLQPLSPQLEL